MIKEVRHIYAEELRKVCIEFNWFTRGTSEEYQTLFDMTYESVYDEEWGRFFHESKNITIEDLEKMAHWIADHSELEEGEDIPCIMYTLANHAMTIFYEETGE